VVRVVLFCPFSRLTTVRGRQNGLGVITDEASSPRRTEGPGGDLHLGHERGERAYVCVGASGDFGPKSQQLAVVDPGTPSCRVDSVFFLSFSLFECDVSVEVM
jgi:hypothetical protein